MAIRTENKLQYAPKLIEFGDNWFKEEYFEGTPINRIERLKFSYESIYKIADMHLNELLLKTKKKFSNKAYKDLVYFEVQKIMNDKIITTSNEILDNINAILNLLFEKLSNSNVDVSWSHGDLQQANILVNGNDFKVIDWEASNHRYFFYDIFTLLSGIRTGISLKQAFENFKIQLREFPSKIKVDKGVILLLLIEELRFSVNEEFSENFYFSGVKTEKLCEAIRNYLNE